MKKFWYCVDAGYEAWMSEEEEKDNVASGPYYLVSDVEAREAQGTAVIKAQRERIAELEKALRWCSEEGAYWNHVLQFFTDGNYEVDAPEDIRRTLSELVE